MKGVRIGLGFDVHRITKRRKVLILGAVPIGCGFGLRAVSDGDVVLHAVCDGILGATARGDIGDYYPPGAKHSQGIKSTEIVKRVLKALGKKHRIAAIDTIIVAQRPPLVRYKPKISASLKKIFGARQINVKVKSKEGLNILGTVNSIACMALVVIERC